jgi:hypothetical protein
MTHFDDIYGLHEWQREDLEDLLEEFPEIENMTTDELNQKYNDLYWEAAGLTDRANRLESKADTIKLYIKYFRGVNK